jgi:hypothetical protein
MIKLIIEILARWDLFKLDVSNETGYRIIEILEERQKKDGE